MFTSIVCGKGPSQDAAITRCESSVAQGGQKGCGCEEGTFCDEGTLPGDAELQQHKKTYRQVGLLSPACVRLLVEGEVHARVRVGLVYDSSRAWTWIIAEIFFYSLVLCFPVIVFLFFTYYLRNQCTTTTTVQLLLYFPIICFA